MINPLRLLAAGLLLAAPLVASATPGAGSDLDRMSDTGGILGRATPKQSEGTGDSFAGPCGPAPCPPPNAPPVPLDGGLSLLAVAGAGYAVRRLRARRAD